MVVAGFALVGSAVGNAFRTDQRAKGGVVGAALSGVVVGEYLRTMGSHGADDVNLITGQVGHGLQSGNVLREAQVGQQAFLEQLVHEAQAFLELFSLIGSIDGAVVGRAQSGAGPGRREVGEGVHDDADDVAPGAVLEAYEGDFVSDAVAVGILGLDRYEILIELVDGLRDLHAQSLAEGVVDQNAGRPRVSNADRPEGEGIQSAVGGQTGLQGSVQLALGQVADGLVLIPVGQLAGLEVGQQVYQVALSAVALAVNSAQSHVHQQVRQGLARGGHQLQLSLPLAAIEQEHLDVDAHLLAEIVGQVVVVVVRDGGSGRQTDDQLHVGAFLNDREGARLVQNVAGRERGRSEHRQNEEERQDGRQNLAHSVTSLCCRAP